MEKLGRFGHHPEPSTDFCVEVDCIEGLLCDVRAGLEPLDNVRKRIDRAMQFRVGGCMHAVNAKSVLRMCEKQANTMAISRECADYRC